jgi:MoxR-like ATPase
MAKTRTSRGASKRRSASRPPQAKGYVVGNMNATRFKTAFDEIVDNCETVIKGKTDVIRLALVALVCEGHILFEDVPGTGKTMLARAFAQSMAAKDNRIQCTPDMLPADITGSSIYDQRKQTFEFQPGPAFANVLLVDEINRATPKTQSALLEAMGERKVSADGKTHLLPRPFFVLATQNPIELAGTFPLPEAQLDRFLFKLTMGYMDRDSEVEVMFDNQVQLAIEDLRSVMDTKTVEQMIAYATTINVAPDVAFYIVDLVHATRDEPALSLGASPRASIALLRASRALAASDGRNDVYPDDVRTVLLPIMAHRVFLNPDSVLRGDTVEAVMERVVSRVKPPSGAAATSSSRGRGRKPAAVSS